MRVLRCVLLSALLAGSLARAEMHVVIVEGLGGNDLYADQFAKQVEAIAAASATVADAADIRIFRAADVSRDAVIAHLDALAGTVDANDQVALYLVGHGSYDDHEYKFNIAGPDLTDADLGAAMDKLSAGNQLLVNTSSASGAVADSLAGDRRLLVLATRSGVERHATRFGNYFATALNDPSADLDKNQVVSVIEAFQYAERQVDDYFERNDTLATEHARLEGERGDRFAIARLTERRAVVGDAELERLAEARDALNAEIDALRLERDSMPAEEYRAELLQKMLELAATEDDIETRERELGIER